MEQLVTAQEHFIVVAGQRMPKGSCGRFFCRVDSLHRLAVTCRQIALVLVGMAGHTCLRSDVLDGGICIEWRRALTLRSVHDVERRNAQQKMQGGAEPVRERLIHGIVWVMTAGLTGS